MGYSDKRDGGCELDVMNDDGTNRTQPTNNPDRGYPANRPSTPGHVEGVAPEIRLAGFLKVHQGRSEDVAIWQKRSGLPPAMLLS